MHKLTAGSGYDYLTRQVAALDATDKGHVGLADLLHRQGRIPRPLGRAPAWTASTAWPPATPSQRIRCGNLFGAGLHPLANQQAADLDDEGGAKASEAVGRLGAPFKVYEERHIPLPSRRAQRLRR